MVMGITEHIYVKEKNKRYLNIYTFKSTIKISKTIYSYWLCSRTPAVFFDPRTDMLPEAVGWVQQVHSRVKQIRCCPRTQSILFCYTLNTFIFRLFYYRMHMVCWLGTFNRIVWMCAFITDSISLKENIPNILHGNYIFRVSALLFM